MAKNLQYYASLSRIRITESVSNLYEPVDQGSAVNGEVSVGFKLEREEGQKESDEFIVRASVNVVGSCDFADQENSDTLFDVRVAAIGTFVLEKGDYESLLERQNASYENAENAPAFQLGATLYLHLRPLLERRLIEFGLQGNVLPLSISNTVVVVEDGS